MKKSIKKLILSRETLARLDSAGLGAAVAGMGLTASCNPTCDSPTCADTCGRTCPDTCHRPCRV